MSVFKEKLYMKKKLVFLKIFLGRFILKSYVEVSGKVIFLFIIGVIVVYYCSNKDVFFNIWMIMCKYI